MSITLIDRNLMEQSEARHQFSICICKSGSPEFLIGEKVAQHMYRKAWKTRAYASKGTYAVVVSKLHPNGDSTPLANVNFMPRDLNNRLPSESIFGERNWECHGLDGAQGIAEICGLAIDDATPPEMRRAVLMMMSMGLQSIALHTKTRWLVTIQHAFLIRILRQFLGLPFVASSLPIRCDAELPRDEYWSRDVMPRLYLLDTHDRATRLACETFFYYLSSLGMTLQITNRISAAASSYSGFLREWESRSLIASPA